MDTCFKCNRTSEEVRLFDGIYINESARVCEKCALLEGIPIVKIPSTNQLKSSEKSNQVYKRLQRISGLDDEKPKKSIFEELKEIDENSGIDKTDESPLNLVENFHWKIQHERRAKGLTHKQLGGIIGESETALRLIERNNLPENVLPVLRKIEQFLRIKIFKDQPKNQGSIRKSIIEPRLRDNGTRIEMVSERESFQQDSLPIASKTESTETSENSEGSHSQILNFKGRALERITVSDLKEINRVIQKDFPTKTSEQIGKEQLEDFGKTQETSEPTKPMSWSDRYLEKRKYKVEGTEDKETGEHVPTIAELTERKGTGLRDPHKDDSLTGDEIELVEPVGKEEKKQDNGLKDIIGEDIEIID